MAIERLPTMSWPLRPRGAGSVDSGTATHPRGYRERVHAPRLVAPVSIAAVALLAGCTGTRLTSDEPPPGSSVPFSCLEPLGSERANAQRAVRVYRGSAAEILGLSAVDAKGYRLVAARVTGAEEVGEHPDSTRHEAVWVTNGSWFAEVTATWDGSLPDGQTLGEGTAARQAALDCVWGRDPALR